MNDLKIIHFDVAVRQWDVWKRRVLAVRHKVGEGRQSTLLSRSKPSARRSEMGHEDAFSRPRLSARCRFGQATFAATQRKGRDALKPVVRGAARGSNLYLRRPVPAQPWSIDRPCRFFSASI
jgi:hypothetical protein